MKTPVNQPTLEKPLKYYSAVTRAFREEMRRDENVVLLGEDVGPSGGIFAQTKGSTRSSALIVFATRQ